MAGARRRRGGAAGGPVSSARPAVLGGRHEVAHGSFLGLAAHAARSAKAPVIGVLNVDAHFDLRTGPRGTSGTPFRQIAEVCAARGWPFRYHCLGVDEASNTAALFDTAARLGASWRSDRDAGLQRLAEVAECSPTLDPDGRTAKVAARLAARAAQS